MFFKGLYSYLNTNDFSDNFLDENHRIKIHPINNFSAVVSFETMGQNVTIINGINAFSRDVTNNVQILFNHNSEFVTLGFVSYEFVCGEH